METIKEKQQKVFTALQGDFGYKNPMAAPKIEKVVVSVGTGKKSRFDRTVNDFIADRLAKITGQKPAARGAKKSIASFKVRAGDPIGQVATLRGARMYAFLDKLINIALPRTKDFRGVKRHAVDEMGNVTIGIKEHTIFPETADEDIKDVFGLSITITTTTSNKEEAIKFFEMIGIPFAKEEK
jgi:large subunit ribosomal protein L5